MTRQSELSKPVFNPLAFNGEAACDCGHCAACMRLADGGHSGVTAVTAKKPRFHGHMAKPLTTASGEEMVDNDNPNHDEQGRFTGPGGGGSIRQAHKSAGVTGKISLTSAEHKAAGLLSTDDQISRYNKAVGELRGGQFQAAAQQPYADANAKAAGGVGVTARGKDTFKPRRGTESLAQYHSRMFEEHSRAAQSNVGPFRAAHQFAAAAHGKAADLQGRITRHAPIWFDLHEFYKANAATFAAQKATKDSGITQPKD